jgi:phage-related protein
MSRPRTPAERPVYWIGSSKRDLLGFPDEVVDDLGYALGVVQFGGTPPTAKPWKGEGPGVFELVEDFRGDTFRAVYTVRFAKAIYVLHCFQKKSPARVRTARPDIESIRRRLRVAQADYEARYAQEES